MSTTEPPHQRESEPILLWASSPSDTVEIGRALAGVLQRGDTLALRGELGAGKTQLVRGLAAGLGADERTVSSPTFVLMQEYATDPRLLHLDAYRLDTVEELETLGWTEPLIEDSISVIEWAERIEPRLPGDRLEIELIPVSDHARQITVGLHRRWIERREPLQKVLCDFMRKDTSNAKTGGKCPICSKPVESDSASFPFCSPRCRQVDLGRWLTGQDRVAREVDWEQDDLDAIPNADDDPDG